RKCSVWVDGVHASSTSASNRNSTTRTAKPGCTAGTPTCCIADAEGRSAMDRFDYCLDVVHREYGDLPGLQLTGAQLRRLLGVDAPTCEALLRRLEQERFLRHTAADDWVLDRMAM